MGYLLVLNQGAEDGLDGNYERPGLEFVVSALRYNSCNMNTQVLGLHSCIQTFGLL